MASLFVDTSGWAHLADPRQSRHARAASVYRSARADGQRIITTNLVLMELAALLASPLRLPKPVCIAFIRDLRHSPRIEVTRIEEDTEIAAWNLWEARADKTWSLVDCASFLLMQSEGVTDVLTDDHHFEQAGFRAVLR
jgi:predicted nucleic acid-binding protein